MAGVRTYNLIMHIHMWWSIDSCQKQGIRWSVTHDRIAGSDTNLSSLPFFWSYPLLPFSWLQAQLQVDLHSVHVVIILLFEVNQKFINASLAFSVGKIYISFSCFWALLIVLVVHWAVLKALEKCPGNVSAPTFWCKSSLMFTSETNKQTKKYCFVAISETFSQNCALIISDF